MSIYIRALTLALSLGALAGSATAQSLTYSRGQNVAPAFEGWEEDADGSKYFVFGYMNRNWEEEPDIPIGPDNSFNIGGDDRGQPTHFLPRRNRFVFRVPVPANFTENDELIWTLTSHGKTERAYASLRTDYKLDTVSKMSETGALGAGTSNPEIRANIAPVVKLEGPDTRSVRVGQPLTLVAVVTDDGVPRRQGGGQGGRGAAAAAAQGRGGNAQGAQGAPAAQGAADGQGAAAGGAQGNAGRGRGFNPPSRVTVGRQRGLFLSWFVYRGAGAVTITPPQIKPWEDTRTGARSPWAPGFVTPPMPPDGRVTATVTFSTPGTYILRGLADDGGLTTGQNVTVTVTP